MAGSACRVRGDSVRSAKFNSGLVTFQTELYGYPPEHFPLGTSGSIWDTVNSRVGPTGSSIHADCLSAGHGFVAAQR